MDRLATHLERLYGPLPADDLSPVRGFVLELARPAGWDRLGPVWRAVQAELELPPPAIAVSGTDAFQLWFSLAVPVDPAEVHGFLDGLCGQHLGDVPPARVRRHVGVSRPRVPSEQAGPEHWSAFVAPDLAPVFADTPWLDIPPSADGQADLLAGLRSIAPDGWAAARATLAASAPPTAPDRVAPEASVPAAPAPAPAAPSVTFPSLAPVTDPRQFLLQVMNDPTVPLALRIDAAKALLPHVPGQATR